MPALDNEVPPLMILFIVQQRFSQIKLSKSLIFSLAEGFCVNIYVFHRNLLRANRSKETVKTEICLGFLLLKELSVDLHRCPRENISSPCLVHFQNCTILTKPDCILILVSNVLIVFFKAMELLGSGLPT